MSDLSFEDFNSLDGQIQQNTNYVIHLTLTEYAFITIISPISIVLLCRFFWATRKGECFLKK